MRCCFAGVEHGVSPRLLSANLVSFEQKRGGAIPLLLVAAWVKKLFNYPYRPDDWFGKMF